MLEVCSGEWQAWFSFWVSGCWRALTKGTAWACLLFNSPSSYAGVAARVAHVATTALAAAHAVAEAGAAAPHTDDRALARAIRHEVQHLEAGFEERGDPLGLARDLRLARRDRVASNDLERERTHARRAARQRSRWCRSVVYEGVRTALCSGPREIRQISRACARAV